MKNMRKLLALVLAVMMVMSLAANAFAAEDDAAATTKITISGGATGSQYTVYKLLNATNDGEKFAYTLNEDYEAVLKSVTGKETEAEIIAYIAEQESAEETRAFADAVYAAVKAMEPDYTITGNGSADVDQGYYLIAETKVGDAADTYSLVMLDTAGDKEITVETKESKPEVDKEVEEKNDSTGASSWGENADHDITDTVNYRITGTVSDRYADYDSYFYSFEDTMSAGLTYNEDAKVYVVNGETETDVTEQFNIVAKANGFTATSNLKELVLPEGVSITATTKIVVEYSCTLNENAVIGAVGNPNEVVLKYENNPYHKADGDNNPKTPNEPETPGETPKDICIVFTYETVVDKVDKDGNALEGAGFTLYKWIASGKVDDPDTDADESGAWEAVGEEITNVTTFSFSGLDEGKYKLVETTIPQGYNKADDVVFTIESETVADTDGDGKDELKNLKVLDEEGNAVTSFTVTVSAGKVETDVVNNAGVELPSTGGIGTTIFYVLGGILVLAAVVLLVTKKRMSV